MNQDPDPRAFAGYEERSIMAIFAGPLASVRVVERGVRIYWVVADDGRTKDCGPDVRLACDTAREWSGLEGRKA